MREVDRLERRWKVGPKVGFGPTNLSDVSVWDADVLMHIVHYNSFILYDPYLAHI